MNMTESEYKNALRAGRGGAYVLCGEESYLIRHYRDRTREPYSSPEAEYDRAVVGYETKADADAIVDAAATPVIDDVDAFDGAGRGVAQAARRGVGRGGGRT